MDLMIGLSLTSQRGLLGIDVTLGPVIQTFAASQPADNAALEVVVDFAGFPSPPLTGHLVAIPAGDTAPDSAQIIAGDNANDQPATLSATVTLTDNTPVTVQSTGDLVTGDFDFYLVVDDGTNLSSVASHLAVSVVYGAGPAQNFTDDFSTYQNGDILPNPPRPYTLEFDGGGNYVISGGVLTHDNSAENHSQIVTYDAQYSGDHFSRFTYGVAPVGQMANLLYVGFQDIDNYYEVRIRFDGYRIRKNVSGTFTTLAEVAAAGSGVNRAPADGDVFTFQRVGNVIAILRDATVVLSVTDSNIATGGQSGFGCFVATSNVDGVTHTELEFGVTA